MSLVSHLKKLCWMKNVWSQGGIRKSISTIMQQRRSAASATTWISTSVTDSNFQHNYLHRSVNGAVGADLCAPFSLPVWFNYHQIPAAAVPGLPFTLEYKLPAVLYKHVAEKSILDPSTSYRAYELPTLRETDVRDAPCSGTVVPVIDPDCTQDVCKVSLPYLMTIRHKKMKKHKRRKLKKRMRFLWRKLRARKMRKREKEMVKFEQNVVREAEEYDVEKYIEERLALARKCGWGIDVVAEYAKKSSN